MLTLAGGAHSSPDPFDRGRSDNRGGAVYLRVHGKRAKVRPVPLYSDAVDALPGWHELRDPIPELADDPWLFSRLGRQRRNGSFPDAGGQLSTSAVIRIVRPLILAAGVPLAHAQPHSCATHSAACTFRSGRQTLPTATHHGSLLTGNHQPLVHHDDIELAAEHRRIERLQIDPWLVARNDGASGRPHASRGQLVTEL